MIEVIWPILGVLASGALLFWFWKPRRRPKQQSAEQPEDLWKAMDDGADPTDRG
ncbi:hypothetical protein [Tessaracoccus sp. MC1756]|uniref:hypothetical protein n=1 Tax=Tessaracoccus sp. MC1756 TaxID=2760311 RepID=UPI001601B997|nr:hypothetical protein [Tessaracoccus sp. MC1756]MBB1509091.1 hypothetical protein [Tessaracoccus sp. MC1756]